SIEAIVGSLDRLNSSEVNLNVIHMDVGGITETDVMLASASKAIIIGFNVRPTSLATRSADREDVEIRLYSVIYEAIADVRAAMEGMLDPELREVISGRAEVIELFTISRMGTIAGCRVDSGRILRTSFVRVIRNNRTIHEGRISSLKRFSDDVRETASGQECGIMVEDFNDFELGDIIESYIHEEVPATL
ncbi:EF-Tu/IF-2/RF-3 family GTPase, partial [Candidatus Poribacteria bacterium]